MQNFHTGAKNRELFFAGICTVWDTTLSDHKCRKKSQNNCIKKGEIFSARANYRTIGQTTIDILISIVKDFIIR
jgi:hypothetical protein